MAWKLIIVWVDTNVYGRVSDCSPCHCNRCRLTPDSSLPNGWSLIRGSGSTFPQLIGENNLLTMTESSSRDSIFYVQFSYLIEM